MDRMVERFTLATMLRCLAQRLHDEHMSPGLEGRDCGTDSMAAQAMRLATRLEAGLRIEVIG